MPFKLNPITGTLDLVELDGPQGATGVIGPGGGDQGATGVQGVTGMSGATGVAGIDGATGVQGQTGVGTAGNQGATGIQGIEGDDGPQGVAGAQGDQGATGVQGIQGVEGDQGVQGIQGVTGFQGITGLQGQTGAQGYTGALGNTGLPGAGQTGIQGLTGVDGLQGQTGAQGTSGETGLVGPQGNAGAQGATGVRGFTGIGADGATGVQGVAGSQGLTGIQGNTGAAGYTGTGGLQGPIGATGVIGVAGATGALGNTGTQGIQGQTGLGVTGPSGGEKGATGVAGADGATGVQGQTGLGVTGPSGGPQGDTGLSLQGATGAGGLQGPIGATGIQGAGGVTGLGGFWSRSGTDLYPTTASDGVTGIGLLTVPGTISTNANILVYGNTKGVNFDSVSAAADKKVWGFDAVADHRFRLLSYNDAKSSSYTAMTFRKRSHGTAYYVDEVDFSSEGDFSFGKAADGDMFVMDTANANFQLNDSDLTVGSNVLFVDESAGRVNIGTASGTDAFTVYKSGGVSIQSYVTANTTDYNLIYFKGGGFADGNRQWAFGQWATTSDFTIRNYANNTNVLQVDYADDSVRLSADLEVTGRVHFKPQATPGSPVKGDAYMDSTSNKLRVYDGTSWNDCW